MTRQHTILIVDDEPINIDVLSGLLKKDYRLIVATNGKRALQAASSGSPDLILLDIMMPDMDGYAVCRRLKADAATREIPVIFVTAMGEVGDETRGFELGAADYITKPVSAPVLRARVKTQLALAQGRKELQAAYATIKAQKERMEGELNVGRDLQMNMMPQDFPGAPGYENFTLHACLEPARELGGDFYDFFFLDDARLCLCVGDVSGKGVPAALFMAVSRTLIRSCAGHSHSTADILSQVNDTLGADNESCMFVTLFIAVYDARSGELVYSNAGHNPPCISTADGGIRRLDRRHGPVAGALQGLDYAEDRVTLAPGDTLLVFTDGITEATNSAGELFGEARLLALLAPGQAPAALIQSIVDRVHEFEGEAEQADDITVMALACHALEAAARPPARSHRSWRGLSRTDEVIAWFNAFAAGQHLDAAIQHRVNAVLDDLLANIIAYAYPAADVGEIELDVVLDDGQLTLALSDDGIAFDPLATEQPDVHLPVEQRAPGGLGIELSRGQMDAMSYQRRDGKNIITLRTGTQV